MGLFNIFRVCSALFLTAALGSAQANYTYDNKTGSWVPNTKTVLAPPGSSSPFRYVYRDSPATVSSNGSFQNKTGGSFGSPPVNGTSRNVPVTINGTTTKPNVNKALLSRLGRGGLAGVALGLGIDALLDGIGALIDGAGNVVRNDQVAVPISNEIPSDYSNYTIAIGNSGLSKSNPDNAARYSGYFGMPDRVVVEVTPHPSPNSFYPSLRSCNISSGSNGLAAYAPPPSGTGSYVCYYSPSATAPERPVVPFPPSELEDAINGGYQPHPSDYPFLAPDSFMIPTIVEVEPIPRLSIPPITTTTVDLDTGKTTIVETNIWQDFNIKDNNSDQPKIEADTTTKTETYTDGQKTSESETTTSSGAATDSGSSVGSGEKLEIDIPTDCDFMPTVCEFLEWYKDDDLGDEPDLASIMKDDEEFAKTKVISFGAAVCPQPYTVHISSLSMSVDLSFEFFCQFAQYARALVLAAAYIFAAYISLGVARG